MKPLLGGFLLSVIMSGVASAQGTAEQSLRDELAQINVSLKDIASALKQQAETQQADLLLKRVTLATTQLSAAEEKPKRIDQEIRGLREQRASFEGEIKTLQERTPSSEEIRGEIAAMKSRLPTIEERIGALNQERIGADNEIAMLRRDQREWQALLDKFLTTRLPSSSTHR